MFVTISDALDLKDMDASLCAVGTKFMLSDCYGRQSKGWHDGFSRAILGWFESGGIPLWEVF